MTRTTTSDPKAPKSARAADPIPTRRQKQLAPAVVKKVAIRRARQKALATGTKTGSRKIMLIKGRHAATRFLVPIEVFRASPSERITRIKVGVLAADAKLLIAGLGIGQGEALKALNLPVATLNKKVKQKQRLDPAESERVLGVAKLVGQVEAMVQESGNPEGFDAGAWVSRWLQEPVPALGGQRPIDLLDTMEGQALVSTTLAQMQSGAYA